MLMGHCHCGSIRYEVHGEPMYSALCHCSDCRRSAGAPVVGWTAFPEASLKVIQGKPKVYKSSEHGRRHFCPDCGTGLFYFNSVNLPGIADLQTATLDDPGCHRAEDSRPDGGTDRLDGAGARTASVRALSNQGLRPASQSG